MAIITTYQTRPVRFLKIVSYNGWRIKCYSISVKSEKISKLFFDKARQCLPLWLQNTSLSGLDNYKIATLILHEGRDGLYAIINWWVDENMLQQFVYFSNYDEPGCFKLLSDKGVFSCVWEMAVIWFERNAWVKNVLEDPGNPCAFSNYLGEYLNYDV